MTNVGLSNCFQFVTVITIQERLVGDFRGDTQGLKNRGAGWITEHRDLRSINEVNRKRKGLPMTPAPQP